MMNTHPLYSMYKYILRYLRWGCNDQITGKVCHFSKKKSYRERGRVQSYSVSTAQDDFKTFCLRYSNSNSASLHNDASKLKITCYIQQNMWHICFSKKYPFQVALCKCQGIVKEVLTLIIYENLKLSLFTQKITSIRSIQIRTVGMDGHCTWPNILKQRCRSQQNYMEVPNICYDHKGQS